MITSKRSCGCSDRIKPAVQAAETRPTIGPKPRRCDNNYASVALTRARVKPSPSQTCGSRHMLYAAAPTATLCVVIVFIGCRGLDSFARRRSRIDRTTLGIGEVDRLVAVRGADVLVQ